MTTWPPPAGWWRLLLGVAAFVLLDPGALGLVALPLAGLLLVAGPARPLEWAVAIAGLALAAARLAPAPQSQADALLSAYVVLTAAAFVCVALLQPAGALRMTFRAIGWGGAAALLLAAARWGGLPWNALLLQVSHEVRAAVPEGLVSVMPAPVLDRGVAWASTTLPATLMLETCAAFALAWQLHVRLSRQPLGAALAPFREFRFGDAWVWGLVVAATVWLVPALGALRTAALNVLVVLGALYLLRGAAVVTALAAAAGVSAAALLLAAALAIVLALPLAVVWLLGLTDTWLEFRRRLAGRPTPP